MIFRLWPPQFAYNIKILSITGFYHVNSSSAPLKDIRTAKKLPGTIFPDYLPLCIILPKFHCLFAQFWYTANKGFIWHLSTLFQMSHIQFHKFQIILNKMIPILSCYTAMQGILIFRALLQRHLLHYNPHRCNVSLLWCIAGEYHAGQGRHVQTTRYINTDTLLSSSALYTSCSSSSGQRILIIYIRR